MRIGIDTGGTFTDSVFLGAGEGRIHKVPSTPDDPLAAILTGLKELCPEGLQGVELVHGTTVGTNAFLERQGARVVLRVQFQGEATGSLPRLRPVAAAKVSLPPRGEVWLPRGRAAARLFYRPDLEPGAVLTGPALILDDYATVLVLPGFQAQAQTQGHLWLYR